MLVVNWKSKEFLLFVLFLQFMFYTTVFFNIPIARQVFGFFYFTFLPGFIIFKLLKLDELDWIETVLFSVGLSVAFLMLAGLLINELGFLFGVSQPLSVMPLMIVLNSLILVGGVLVCSKSEDVKIWKSEPIDKSPFVLLFLCLPILSILGVMYVNIYGNNLLLLFMIIAISLLFVIGVLSKRLLPSKLYPFGVLMIAVAILFHSSIISNYIVPFGSDVPLEYFIFKTTQSNAYWDSANPSFGRLQYGRVHSMLSVTILPTIYLNLLNMNATWMFKIIFPLIFSFVPLGLYQVWKEYLGKKYAFISAFLFMAYATFYTEMLGLNRQIVGELFFVMLLIVVLNKRMKPLSKMVCFMIFSFGLVTSHYGLSEIFLFIIFLTFISLFVVKRPSRNITVTMILSFFILMFAWYIFTSDSTVFDSILQFSDRLYRQLGDFFDPASRGREVMQGLGLESPPTICNAISRAFGYTTQFLIVVGFVGLVTRRVKVNLERNYFSFSLIAMICLAALILVPGLADTMKMTRFYHILLFFLAPLCVMGAEVLVKLVSKRKEELLVSILLLIVLVPYFLFQTGFVHEVIGSESWSIPLGKHRTDALRLYGSVGYTDAFSVYGARWVSINVDLKKSNLYADGSSRSNVLTIYGMIYPGYVNGLSNVTIVADNGVVYLSTLNVVEDIIPSGRLTWNYSELSIIFDDLNIIYTNGGSEIYKHSP